jgi:hypothetical protein
MEIEGAVAISSVTIIEDEIKNFNFVILTASSLPENEIVFQEFLRKHFNEEYERKVSTIAITFEMILQYIKSVATFSSFLVAVETEALKFKDQMINSISKRECFKLSTEEDQKKIKAEYYHRARTYIHEIGILMYDFLKEYYCASIKNEYNKFLAMYPFMENNKQLLSVDSMKCIANKVFKEDFLMIQAQKRTGLLTTVKSGVLGKVLQDEEVKEAFVDKR